jgi:hypothetical protein
MYQWKAIEMEPYFLLCIHVFYIGKLQAGWQSIGIIFKINNWQLSLKYLFCEKMGFGNPILNIS